MLSCANALALMQVTLVVFPGFDQLAGLSFGWMGSGLELSVSGGLGGDTGVALAWKQMLPLTQSIDGL